MKVFNTTASCSPEEHYMVDISNRIADIRKLVDAGKYFTINRARQYGKTTTLNALDESLSAQYDVVSLDFQDMTDANFADENAFTKGFAQLLCDTKNTMDIPLPDEFYDAFQKLANTEKPAVLNDVFRIFDNWCKNNERLIVLIIDEVDSATNNQVFLDFLGKLRSNYIKRTKNRKYRTFQSVVLAGVTDVKHIKSKIRPDEDADKENSPWNIAADFLIDMSLSEDGIRGMLDEYEADHHTGMNTVKMAKLIWEQTSGYPFLVSRICQLIDEQVSTRMGVARAWSGNGFNEAVKLLLAENNTLFQSMTRKLKEYPGLKKALHSILMNGTKLTYTAQTDSIAVMQMYGLIKNDHNTVVVANRTFEQMLYNIFFSEEEMQSNVFSNSGELDKNRYIKNGKLNMKAVLEGFIHAYTQTHGELKESFDEEQGRKSFLLYLKPIINGTGNFYVEAETRSQRRTDVIVDYLGEQFVIELKIWKGAKYNEDGEKQITDYLDELELKTGYMLTFNFNKKKEKGIREVELNGKKIIEAVV